MHHHFVRIFLLKVDPFKKNSYAFSSYIKLGYNLIFTIVLKIIFVLLVLRMRHWMCIIRQSHTNSSLFHQQTTSGSGSWQHGCWSWADDVPSHHPCMSGSLRLERYNAHQFSCGFTLLSYVRNIQATSFTK